MPFSKSYVCLDLRNRNFKQSLNLAKRQENHIGTGSSAASQTPWLPADSMETNVICLEKFTSDALTDS